MKRILPSLRQKKRYLAFEIVADRKITSFEAVSKAIWENSLALLGEIGVGRAGIWVLPEKFNSKIQRGIIKVNNQYVPHLKSALLMIETIGSQTAILKSVGVSGILNKAEQKYMVEV